MRLLIIFSFGVLLLPADPCAPIEPVGECAEVCPAGPVAERCDDGGCDEEVFGADAERDRVWGASGGHGRNSRLRFSTHSATPVTRTARADTARV